MLFQRYRIVIFKENSGDSLNFRSRGWPLFVLVLLVIGLSISTAWLFTEHQKLRAAKSRLAEAELNFEEQQAKLVALLDRLSVIRNDLNRIQTFDTKLRAMMSIDGEFTPVGGAQGGPESDLLAPGKLPLHRQALILRKLNTYLSQLAAETRLEELRQQELLLTMRHTRELLPTVPTIWPVEGFLTSRFGRRTSPFTGQVLFHKGIDISARPGTPVSSTAGGKVILAGMDGAYGNSVIIDHGAGITTRYAHMKSINVQRGQTISRGDQVGSVGSTGRSSGPHLHYEVHVNNVPVDPMHYILN